MPTTKEEVLKYLIENECFAEDDANLLLTNHRGLLEECIEEGEDIDTTVKTLLDADDADSEFDGVEEDIDIGDDDNIGDDDDI